MWNALRWSAAIFWRDTRGIILPYVTVMLVVIVGVSVLALDGARYMSLQTQLQNGADALALAGAAELDGMPDAETRATNAVNSLLANSTLFGSGSGTNVQISRIDFYSELPGSDELPISAATAASSASGARFIAVTARPVTLSTILPASFFGGANSVTTGASAVAGFDQVVCQAPPLFVCNPFEGAGMSYDQASRALQMAVALPSVRRRLMRLAQHGDAARPYLPGDYGFLAAAGVDAAPASVVDALAAVHPRTCFLQRRVNFDPITVASVREGFNVRFDLYEGAMRPARSDSNYRPALNVRKGYAGNSCTAQPSLFWPVGDPPTQATGLLFDRSWPLMNGRMGSGIWDFSTYWQVNHGADGRPPPMLNGEPASNSNLPSRYAVYRYEIEQRFVGDRSPGGETGAAACYTGADLSDVPDRRVLTAAIVNCQSLALAGGPHADVPVTAFGKFFLTLPLQRSQTDIFVEIVGLLKPGDSGDFEMVQLYR
jgi:hypothetical protein